MPNLILLMGLPASGKSTWRAKYASKDAVVISTDDFIDRWAEIRGQTYSEVFEDQIKPATRYMQALFNDSIRARRDIIVDQTLLSAKKRHSYISQARQFGYTVEIYVFMPPIRNQIQEHERRLASRVGKNIPNHVIQSMKENFQMPTADEAEMIYYIDNWSSPR